MKLCCWYGTLMTHVVAAVMCPLTLTRWCWYNPWRLNVLWWRHRCCNGIDCRLQWRWTILNRNMIRTLLNTVFLPQFLPCVWYIRALCHHCFYDRRVSYQSSAAWLCMLFIHNTGSHIELISDVINSNKSDRWTWCRHYFVDWWNRRNGSWVSWLRGTIWRTVPFFAASEITWDDTPPNCFNSLIIACPSVVTASAVMIGNVSIPRPATHRSVEM